MTTTIINGRVITAEQKQASILHALDRIEREAEARNGGVFDREQTAEYKRLCEDFANLEAGED